MIKCLHEMHEGKDIIRICLSRDCKKKRKACEICWIQDHQDHLLDCVDFSFVKLILLHEQHILQRLQKEIIVLQLPNTQSIQAFNQMIEDIIAQIKQSIENLNNEDFTDLDILVNLTLKCHNQIIHQEIMHMILVDFSSIQESLLGDKIKKLLNKIYNENDEAYELEKLCFQGNDLYAANQFEQALGLFEIILKQKSTQDLIQKKFNCLFELYRFDDIVVWKENHMELNLYSKFFEICCRSKNMQTYFQNLKLNFDFFFQFEKSQLAMNLNLEFYYHFSTGDFQKALNILDQHLLIYQNDALATFLKSVILIMLNKNLEAEETLTKALQLNPENKITQYLLRVSKFNQGEEKSKSNQQCDYNSLKSGVDKFDLFVERIHQKKNLILWEKSELEVMRKQAKFAQAIELLEIALAELPKNKYLWIQKSFCLIELHRFNEAEECIQVAQAYHPNDNFFYILQSLLLFNQGKWRDAIQLSDKIIATTEFQSKALEIKGKSLYLLNEVNQSFECFDQLIQFSPFEAKIIQGIRIFCEGYILFQAKQLDQALVVFEEAETFDHKDRRAIYYSGLTLFNLQQWEQASQNFEQIIDFKDTIIFYVLALAKIGKVREAYEILLNFRVQDKEKQSSECIYDEYLCELVECDLLIKQKLFGETLKKYKSMDENIILRFATASYCMTLIELNELEEAQVMLKKNLKDHITLSFIQGFLLELRNQQKEALDWYQKSIDQNQNAQAICAKMHLLYKMQRFNEAGQTQELLENVFPEYNQQTSVKDSIYDLILFNFNPQLLQNEIQSVKIEPPDYLHTQFQQECFQSIQLIYGAEFLSELFQ